MFFVLLAFLQYEQNKEMIEIKENYPLNNHNTFGIECRTRYFVSVKSENDLIEIFKSDYINKYPWLVLGGGSNVLFTRDFPGLIISMDIKYVQKLEEDDNFVKLRVAAGEEWDELVEYTVENHYGGLENLSYIPGKAGAAPIQNIGAYGVEVKDVVEHVGFYHVEKKSIQVLKKHECNFSYRDSIFKHELKGKAVVLYLVIKLSKKHILKTSYGNIELELQKYTTRNVKNLREIIINIRKSKLPEPGETGNAGSFFKNPVVKKPVFLKLKEIHSNIPSYPVNDEKVKIPAAWLIEQCGWKGKNLGTHGVHGLQPLVLVNHGGASGNDIYMLAKEVQQSVKDKFGILLDMEVNVI
jgi:UDP-N-acetylmuramate dehydrogenase